MLGEPYPCTCAIRHGEAHCRLESWKLERERMPPRFSAGMIERAIKVCRRACRKQTTSETVDTPRAE